MKFRFNSRYFRVLIVLSALALQACDFETSDNGDLDGFWHMESVDTLATGGVSDLSQHRQFWAFSVKLLRLTDNDGVSADIYMRFSHQGDSLKLYEPYSNYGHEQQDGDAQGGDIPLKDPVLLAPYGVSGLQDGFMVEVLSGSRMILKSEKLRLRFRKF